MATYIAWRETKVEFVEWKYTGGGEHDAVTKEVAVTKRARWSADEDEKTQENAKRYIETDVPGGWIEIIAD